VFGEIPEWDLGEFMSGEEKVKRRLGDRNDARRIRNNELDGCHAFFPYIMPKRTEAEVWIKEKMDCTDLMKYVKDLNEANPGQKTTYFHAFVTAIAKVVYMRPLLNRYIIANKYYERHDIILSFVAKRKFEEEAAEVLISMKVKPDQTLKDVSKLIVGDVSKVRNDGTNTVDASLDFLKKLPRWVNSIFSGLMRILIYFDLYPKGFQKGDTNYSSVLISNLGSIKCDAPYHHLNNYGTNSVVLCIGEIHKEELIDNDGNKAIRDVVNFGITLDERIGDGFYFARTAKLLKYIIANPTILERPIGEKIEYND